MADTEYSVIHLFISAFSLEAAGLKLKKANYTEIVLVNNIFRIKK